MSDLTVKSEADCSTADGTRSLETYFGSPIRFEFINVSGHKLSVQIKRTGYHEFIFTIDKDDPT